VTVAFLIVCACAALVDWLAVQLRLFRIEYLAKPLTLAALLVAAAIADLGPAQPWVVAALACGLAGDVALMASDKARPDAAFLAGLGAFLLGHVAYIGGFVRHGMRAVDLGAGALLVVGLFALVMPAVLRGAYAQSGAAFAALVAGYAGAVGAMTVCAVGTGVVAVAAGGVVFAVSDSTLGYQRFVRALPYGDLAVMVTYHVAQFLIVVGLIRAR
jgi:uncharacterized membrane protein YhhN